MSTVKSDTDSACVSFGTVLNRLSFISGDGVSTRPSGSTCSGITLSLAVKAFPKSGNFSSYGDFEMSGSGCASGFVGILKSAISSISSVFCASLHFSW